MSSPAGDDTQRQMMLRPAGGAVGGPDDRQCLPCHSTCASCVGQLSTDCVRCSEGLLWSRGRCLPTCDHL